MNVLVSQEKELRLPIRNINSAESYSHSHRCTWTSENKIANQIKRMQPRIPSVTWNRVDRTNGRIKRAIIEEKNAALGMLLQHGTWQNVERCKWNSGLASFGRTKAAQKKWSARKWNCFTVLKKHGNFTRNSTIRRSESAS